jgi:pimeloyl-ACP methyl ester carboxylesterase
MRALSATLPGAAARLAARLWCTPPRPPRTPAASPLDSTATTFTIAADGRHVAAWSWGEGPPVLLVHGWGGYAAQLHPFVEPLVARGHQVIAFDAPGHGRSDASTMGGRQTHLLEFARALRLVAAHAGRPHAVVAHSLGCTATALAIAGGLAPARAAFVAPMATPTVHAARFAQALGLPAAVDARWRRQLADRLGFRWEDLDTTCVPDSAPTPPLLVIHDQDDRETPWEDGQAIADRWPNATLHTTHGLGHRRILRDPDVTARVAAFVAGGR